MLIEPMEMMKWSALAVSVTFVICTVLLIGFRRGRLRGFNIYVTFSIAVLAARAYGAPETGQLGGWWGAAVWINLAACGIWGVVGMLQIAGIDPPVYMRRPSVPENRPVVVAEPTDAGSIDPDDEVPVHDAKVLEQLDAMGKQVAATGEAVNTLAEPDRARG